MHHAVTPTRKREGLGRLVLAPFTVLALVTFTLLASTYATSTYAKGEAQPSQALSEPPTAFGDLPSGHWAEEAVRRLSEEGILIGYPDGTFGGERTLTRYEMAVIIARLLGRLEAVAATLDTALRDALESLEAQNGLGARVAAVEAELERAATQAELGALRERMAELEAVLVASPPDRAGLEAGATLASDPATGLAGAIALGGAEAGEVFVPGRGLVGPDGSPIRRLYLGVTPGIVSSSGVLAFGVQAGYDRLLGPVGAAIRFHYDSGLGAFRLSAGAQAHFSPFDAPLELYAGLGAGLLLRETSSAFLELPLGLELYLTPRYGLFVQVVSSVSLEEGGVDSYLAAGLNIRF